MSRLAISVFAHSCPDLTVISVVAFAIGRFYLLEVLRPAKAAGYTRCHNAVFAKEDNVSKMAITGKIIWFTSTSLLATFFALENIGRAAEQVFPDQGLGFPDQEQVFSTQRQPETIPTPDASHDVIPWERDVDEGYLDEGMARALEWHRGVSLDGSTYSEDPIGPCDFLGKGVCCPPTWYTEQQVRVLTRSRARGRGLSGEYLPDESALFETAVLAGRMGTKSITFDGAEGYSMTIGRHLWRDSENRDHFAEFTFWGFNSWDDWTQASGKRISPFAGLETGSLFSPFDQTVDVLSTSVFGGFNFADVHRFSYQSHIHNWELNSRIRPRIRKDRLVLQPSGRWRREERSGPHYSFLYGFRVANIGERSLFHSRSRIIDDTDVFNTSGDYHVRTGNNMVGLQIGGDMIHRYNKWSWGFRGKTSAMVNSAHQISTVRSDGFGLAPNFRVSDSRSALAAIIEFGVTGKYMLTPHVWLTGGYDLMWITGLALAPEQMDFGPTPSGRVNMGGTVFYHGLTAGFEWTF